MDFKHKLVVEILGDPTKKLLINDDWCKSCGICMQLCQREVLGESKVAKKVILLAPEKCNGCGLCELICPDYVFSILSGD